MSPNNSNAVAPSLPQDREELVAQVGEPKALIYNTVRQILNDLEHAAPWDSLYYPPANTEDFLRMTGLLILVIEGIPERVATLTQELEGLNAPEEMVGDFEFFFHGIHTSVEQELTKLKALFASFQQAAPEKEPTPDERDFSCELSADLKGKYSSSIMGASASLVAEGQWRGVEIEPILYPEKAQEFARNEKLVETLSEVTENIQNLLEQVPLAELVASWRGGQRVDQYALTALYSLLGNLGKLMREDSRRALYSGDYHQIQRREALLAARVNELTTLHNTSWGTMPPGLGLSPEDAYPRMVQAATELATVLSTDILKKIIGGKQVEDLLNVVMLEKEANSSVDRWRSGHQIKPHRSRERIPEHLHSLIILLYDEDLNTFLELLLGSVLKRASLTVRKDMQDAPSPKQMEEMLEALGESPTPPEEPTPPEPAPAVQVAAAQAPPAPPAVASPGVTLPGTHEEEAYRAAAPPEVPDIGVVDLPEVDYGHATPPPSPSSTKTTAAGVSYPEIDYGAIEVDESFGTTPPAAHQASPPPSPQAPTTPSAALFVPDQAPTSFAPPEADAPPSSPATEFHAFEPPAEDFLSPLQGDFLNPPGDEFTWQANAFDAGLEVPALDASTPVPAPAPTSSTGGGPSHAEKQQLMGLLTDLEVLVNQMTSSSSSHHKSFLMVHRLLKRGRAIPPAMVQSMQPYLFDLMNELLPKLHEGPLEEDFGDYANRLIQDCQLLCQLNFSGDELKTHVTPAMQNIVELLDELRQMITQKIDSLAGY